MVLSEEQKLQIINCGAFGYSCDKTMNVLGINEGDRREFIKDFDDIASEVYINYHRGVDQADYLIDSKLWEMVRAGDLKALKTYEQRKRRRNA